MDVILGIASVMAWIMIGFLTVAVLMLGRAHGELSQYVQEMKLEESRKRGGNNLVGQMAPDFRLKVLGQKRTITRTELAGHPTLLAFISPTCHHCHAVMGHLSQLYDLWHEWGGELLGISSGDAETMQERAREWGVRFPILMEEQWEVTRLYQVPGTPYGVVINTHGKIAAMEVLQSEEHIAALLSNVVPDFHSKLKSAGITKTIK